MGEKRSDADRADDLAEVEVVGGSATIRFDRVALAPQDEVWRALTDEGQLADWFNVTIKIDPRRGGELEFSFGTDSICRGTVIEASPPTALRYDWRFPGDLTMRLSWTLAPSAPPERDATSLVLEHAGAPARQVVAFAAGWHAHLDALDALLRGEAPDRSIRRSQVWQPRFEELRPRYERALAPLLVNGEDTVY